MNGNSSEIKFTKEDREKLQEELEKEEQEKIQEEQEDNNNKKEQTQKEKTKKKTKHKTKNKHSKDKEKEKKDKKDKRRKKDKNNKAGIPFSYILILLLIIAIIAAIGIYYYIENEKDVELEDWQQAYYTFLENGIIKKGKDALNKELDNYSLAYTEKSPKIYMLEVEDIIYPVMISESNGIKEEYQNENNKNVKKVYTIHSIGYNKQINYEVYYDADNIVFLYNKEKEEYNWYLYDKEQSQDTYIAIDEIVNNSIDNSTKYIFENKEEFDNNFIKINTNFSKYKIINNISENRLKNTIRKASENMKKLDSILTDKVINKINDKINENNEEVQESEIEEKDTPTKEVEEKEQEETSSGIKAGKYTISYGIYENNQIRITLKNSGICTYEDIENETKENCTYNVEGDSNSGFQLVVSLKEDTEYYIISGNNKLGNLNYKG